MRQSAPEGQGTAQERVLAAMSAAATTEAAPPCETDGALAVDSRSLDDDSTTGHGGRARAGAALFGIVGAGLGGALASQPDAVASPAIPHQSVASAGRAVSPQPERNQAKPEGQIPKQGGEHKELVFPERVARPGSTEWGKAERAAKKLGHPNEVGTILKEEIRRTGVSEADAPSDYSAGTRYPTPVVVSGSDNRSKPAREDTIVGPQSGTEVTDATLQTGLSNSDRAVAQLASIVSSKSLPPADISAIRAELPGAVISDSSLNTPAVHTTAEAQQPSRPQLIRTGEAAMPDGENWQQATAGLKPAPPKNTPSAPQLPETDRQKVVRGHTAQELQHIGDVIRMESGLAPHHLPHADATEIRAVLRSYMRDIRRYNPAMLKEAKAERDLIRAGISNPDGLAQANTPSLPYNRHVARVTEHGQESLAPGLPQRDYEALGKAFARLFAMTRQPSHDHAAAEAHHAMHHHQTHDGHHHNQTRHHHTAPSGSPPSHHTRPHSPRTPHNTPHRHHISGGNQGSAPGAVTHGPGSAHGGESTSPSPEQAASLAGVRQPYHDIFNAAAKEYYTNPAFLATIFYIEHRSLDVEPPAPYGNGAPWATSPVGAEGPFQFMPGTWQEYAVDANHDGTADPQDLTDAAYAAAKMLHSMGVGMDTPLGSVETYGEHGTLLYAALSYNWGAGNVDAAYAAGVPYDQIVQEAHDYGLLMLHVYPAVLAGEQIPDGLTPDQVLHAPAPQPPSPPNVHPDPKPHPDKAPKDNGPEHLTTEQKGERIAQTALNFAWKTTGHGPDESDATPAYKSAMRKYDGSTGEMPYSDCGVAVATAVRESGMDSDYPVRGTSIQLSYLEHSHKWQGWDSIAQVPGGLKPGDVLIFDNPTTAEGHTYIYVGEQPNGYNSVSASLYGHVPEPSNAYPEQNGNYFHVFRLK